MALKYNCDSCDYSTDRLDNYKRHLVSKRHSEKPRNGSNRVKLPESPKSSSQQTIELKNELNTVKENAEYQLSLKDKEYELKQIERDLLAKQLELLQKEQQYLKRELEIQKLKNELDIKTRIINNQDIFIDQPNNARKKPSFIYIKNNYEDAPVYIDMMAPYLTDVEIRLLEDDPILTCAKIIATRCLVDVELDERPLHCLDMNRNKFAVRCYSISGVPKWKIDFGGEDILNCLFEKIKEEVPDYEINKTTTFKNKILKELCEFVHSNT